MTNTVKVGRSLDVGLGYTKYSQGHYARDGTIRMSAIPSVAVLITSPHLDHGATDKLDVIQVEVGKQSFLVGPNSLLAASSHSPMLPTRDFFKTSNYMAILLGAMANLNIQKNGRVDHLSVGLTLEQSRDRTLCSTLKNFLKSVHRVPDIDKLSKVREIEILEVSILAQPIGTLINQQLGFKNSKNDETTLIIDVGFGTLGWVVASGLKVATARSGDCMGGASTIIQQVIKKISLKSANNIGLMYKVDSDIRLGKTSIFVDGNEIGIDLIQEIISTTARGFLSILLRQIGDYSDINRIIVSGGGVHLYLNEIKKVFESRQIIIPTGESRYENLRGFQLFAEKIMGNDNVAS